MQHQYRPYFRVSLDSTKAWSQRTPYMEVILVQEWSWAPGYAVEKQSLRLVLVL